VARRVDGGYLLAGDAPWVTGWDMVDTLYVAARDEDTIVWALLDALAMGGAADDGHARGDLTQPGQYPHGVLGDRHERDQRLGLVTPQGRPRGGDRRRP